MVNPLAHPVCLAWPRRLTAVRAWHEHIPFAMVLVDLLRPRVVVELGVHAGDSYCALCQAVSELNLDTRCYGIDTWQGDAHAGFYGAGVLDDLRAHHDPLYGTFSSLIPSTFDDAVSQFADGMIDLLHVDGYHTYDAVRHDFEAWLPKMSAGGVVLLHDTNVHERDFGIGRFWDEIKDRYPHFEFHHGHGLGVAAVGHIRSPELQAMLDANPDEVVTIRSFFFQLGRRLSLTDDVDALQRRLEDTQAELAAGARPQGPPTEVLTPEEPQASNVLQLFWDDGGGFSEARSLSTPLITDDEIHQYVLWLPSTAGGPLRLDPGNHPAYVEIHRLELGASDDGDGAGGEVLCRWSAAQDDVGLIPRRGLARLAGYATHRFRCTDADPQLLLTGVPERHDARPWFVRATLRVSGRVLGIVADEIGRLDRALAEHERAFEASEAHWRGERARLAEQGRVAQSLADDLGRARDHIASLEARAAEQANASEALHAERARLALQVEAHEHALQSLASGLEQAPSLHGQTERCGQDISRSGGS